MTAEELSKGAPQRFCSRREPVAADVDGDLREDQVFHTWVKGQALVGACTAAGERDSRPGLGQSELLQLIDVDGDGRDEVLFGATGIVSGAFQIARFLDGRLRLLRGPSGREPLRVWQGVENVMADGHLAEEQTGAAFGCDDVGGVGKLVQVTTRFRRQGIRWRKTWFSLNGTSAEIVARDGGTEQRGEGESRIDVLSRAAQNHVSPCEVRESS